MKKQMLLAAIAGVTLVSAHPGPKPEPLEARTGYPPCSRTVTDRCIQLNERAARAPANLARNSTAAGAPLPAHARSRAASDDIDVSYAGEVLQAPRAGHRPDMDRPTRVVVIREQRRAHALPVEAVAAHAAAHPPRAVASPVARHAVQTAAAAPRAHHSPRRHYSMRIRRAGERG